MNNNKPKYTVRIRTDHVTNDPKQTQQILDRVSQIISNSYRRMQQEGCAT